MKQLIYPEKLSKKEAYQLLIGSVAPRPIAFVSTYNEDLSTNVAPYSFFMGISASPPIVAFSVSNPSGPLTEKDTLFNAKYRKELVINSVHYDMIQQTAMSSIPFPHGTSEFIKTGLTAIKATIVNAPLVKESHINMECKVRDIIRFGDHPGAGNLVICDVVLFHIKEDIVTDGRIDPDKADLMGRMGRAFYTRASGDAIFSFYQKSGDNIIGYENLPRHVRESHFLSANDIATMSRLTEWPDQSDLTQWQNIHISNPESLVRELINAGEPKKALALLITLTDN